MPFAGEIPLSAETATKAFGKRKTLSVADSIVQSVMATAMWSTRRSGCCVPTLSS